MGEADMFRPLGGKRVLRIVLKALELALLNLKVLLLHVVTYWEDRLCMHQRETEANME
jgi:hypothetical protein